MSSSKENYHEQKTVQDMKVDFSLGIKTYKSFMYLYIEWVYACVHVLLENNWKEKHGDRESRFLGVLE